MEKSPKSKVRIYILALSLFMLAALICVVAIALTGINSIVFNMSDIGYMSEEINYLHSARLSFESTKRLSRDLAIYAGDTERIDAIISRLSYDRGEILADIDISSIIYSHDKYMLQTVFDLLSNYDEYISQMVELAADGDAQAVKTLLDEVAPLTAEIGSVLEELTNEKVDSVLSSVEPYEYLGNLFSTALIVIVVVVAIIVIVATSRILLAASKLLDTEQEKRGYSPNQYYSGELQNDGRELPELERCATDLKAVTYDLAKSVKELKK